MLGNAHYFVRASALANPAMPGGVRTRPGLWTYREVGAGRRFRRGAPAGLSMSCPAGQRAPDLLFSLWPLPVGPAERCAADPNLPGHPGVLR